MIRDDGDSNEEQKDSTDIQFSAKGTNFIQVYMPIYMPSMYLQMTYLSRSHQIRLHLSHRPSAYVLTDDNSWLGTIHTVLYLISVNPCMEVTRNLIQSFSFSQKSFPEDTHLTPSPPPPPRKQGKKSRTRSKKTQKSLTLFVV